MPFIKEHTDRNTRTITLVRAELHNAFNEVVIEELTKAFVEAGRREDVRVVVLAAEGKSFCAGADINWMKRMVGYSFNENLADANDMANMLRAIRECPKPVIARVHGAAIGGGVGLTAACDIAVALRSAVFSLSEVKLGIIPAVISPFVLEKIGPGQMRRYGLTAERFDADEALRIGLVHEVVDTIEELDATIARLVEGLKANGPRALAACKEILTEVVGVPWDEVQRTTTSRIAELRVSDEGQDGLKAFLEKRKPGWMD
jgi:methylglutaconyl-CoA hydratase